MSVIRPMCFGAVEPGDHGSMMPLSGSYLLAPQSSVS